MCKMSKVRVSNGSPTLERVDARQADHVKPSVCRTLFGPVTPVDREDFARDAKDQMREMEKASKKKWNYDFAKNEPLAPGNYEWQEVDAKEVPEFYIRPPHVKRASSNVTGTVDHNGNHDYLLTTPSLESVGGDSDSTQTGSRTDCRTALSTPRKRPSTEDRDLPCQSKRPNVLATEANPCPDTSSLEQAPSKSDPKT
ncbi:cyclin-dependent kinase inhibitor 1Ba [Pseudorasbora parva]|uniref:cyclin-dependent kinase inhibitor 1Ba n=1 Tax=Pseudorasbora parva TaxID=51549 RepID=UPI00351F7C84